MIRRPDIGVSEDGNKSAIGGVETDHHSGYQNIEAGNEIQIEKGKQMTVRGLFIQDGFLIQDGGLIQT